MLHGTDILRFQYQGADAENPVIIWLHGGPASPDTFANYTFQKYLVDDYTIINWDQRGCGRTYFRNADTDAANKTASFEQAQTDLNELVDYACARFHTERVIIVGHSYGTMLGSRYVLNHPEKVLAYIGVSQLVTMESELYSYEDALEKAAALGDDTQALEAAYQRYTADKSLTSNCLIISSKLMCEITDWPISCRWGLSRALTTGQHR